MENKTPDPNIVDSIWSINCGFSIKPFITQKGDIVYTEQFSSNPKGESIMKVNGLNGTKIFEWNNYLHSPKTIQDIGSFFKDEIMIFSNGPRNYCINTSTGNTIWRTQLLNYGASAALYFDGKDNYYQSMSKSDYQVEIFKTSIESGKREVILSLYDSTRRYPIIQIDPIVIAQNSQNQNILLIVTNYFPDFDSIHSIQKIYSLNLETKKIDWQKDYKNEINEFQSNIYKTIGNRTLLAGFNLNGRQLACINNDNGEIIWQQKLPDFCTSLDLFQDQVVSTCHGKNEVTSYDIKTGTIIWTQTFNDQKYSELNFDFNNSTIFKNYLISTQCNYLLALNLYSGHVVCYKKLAYGSGCLRNGVAINESRRLFYVNDRFRILCYPLPEEISY